MSKETNFSVGHTIYFLNGTKTIVRGTVKCFLYPHHFRVHGQDGVFDLNLAGMSPEEAFKNYKRVKLEHFKNKLETTQRTIDRIEALDFADYKIKKLP